MKKNIYFFFLCVIIEYRIIINKLWEYECTPYRLQSALQIHIQISIDIKLFRISTLMCYLCG